MALRITSHKQLRRGMVVYASGSDKTKQKYSTRRGNVLYFRGYDEPERLFTYEIEYFDTEVNKKEIVVDGAGTFEHDLKELLK